MIFNFASRSNYSGSRTTKEEAGRSRSRSRSRSSSPSSSSPPSPDRQNKYRSKNEHELTHAAAEKTRSNSRGTSTGTRSTDVQLNGNNRTNSEHISRHRHDRHRDGKDESKGWFCLKFKFWSPVLCIGKSISIYLLCTMTILKKKKNYLLRVFRRNQTTYSRN